MSERLINDFCQIYQTLAKDNLDKLGLVYQQDVIFIDPVHQLQGLNALTAYFSNLYKNMLVCRFTIEQVVAAEQQASVIWTMHYRHSKINNGNSVAVNGCSFLKYNDKIFYHRDFFDMGQMLYEQLPLLGGAISMVKKRIVR